MKELIIKTIISFLCCLLVGLARYQLAIFNVHDPRFVFIVFGLVLPVFYYTILLFGITPELFWMCAVFVANSIFLRAKLGVETLAWDAVYLALITCSVYLFFVFINKQSFKNKIIYYPLAGILVASGALIHHILFLFFNPGFETPGIIYVLKMIIPEFLTGLGVGIGIYVSRLPVVAVMFGLEKREN